jgi:hypothetical protein
MGGWLGRLASRYRLPLNRFAEHYGLELPLTATRAGWLLLPPLPERTLKQIARVVRTSIALLDAIQTPAAWITRRQCLPVCGACLFVNPVDATSPYWKRAWLAPDALPCEIHDEEAHWVDVEHLRPCRNFAQALKVVGYYEAYRRGERDGLPLWPSPYLRSATSSATRPIGLQ